MAEEYNIYGTVVKRTVMEEGVDYSKGTSCRHSADTIHYTEKPGCWSQVLIKSVIFLTLGGSIPVGYVCGISTNPYHVEDAWVSLPTLMLRQLMLVGGVLGATVTVILADSLGRRWTTVIGQITGLVGALAHLTASFTQSQSVLVFAWIDLGLFIGIGMCVLPMYLVELAPHPLRASLGTIYTVGTSLGVMLSQMLGLHCALATGSGHPFLVPVFLLPVLVSWFFFRHIPESPTFLYFVDNNASAAAVELMKLRGTDIASVEAELSRDGLKCESDNFITQHLLKLPMLVLLLCAAHLSLALGESDQLYHLSSARPRLSESDVVAVGYTASVINCIVALVLVQLITSVSWRVLLIISCAASSALLLVMAALARQQDPSDQTMYLMLVILLVQVFVFDLGLRPIPCFLACELFDPKTSAAMMGLGGAVNFLGQIASDYLSLHLGAFYFRLFSSLAVGFSFILVIFVYIAGPKECPVQRKAGAAPNAHPTPRVSHLPNPH